MTRPAISRTIRARASTRTDSMAATKPEQLIPADSPHLSQRTIAELINRVPLSEVVGQLQGMLSAKTPQGNPDWRARESGVKLWLSYVIGLPVQRQEIVTHKVSSIGDSKQLLRSPATLDAIRRQLAGTEEGAALAKALSNAGKVSVEPIAEKGNS